MLIPIKEKLPVYSHWHCVVLMVLILNPILLLEMIKKWLNHREAHKSSRIHYRTTGVMSSETPPRHVLIPGPHQKNWIRLEWPCQDPVFLTDPFPTHFFVSGTIRIDTYLPILVPHQQILIRSGWLCQEPVFLADLILTYFYVFGRQWHMVQCSLPMCAGLTRNLCIQICKPCTSMQSIGPQIQYNTGQE